MTKKEKIQYLKDGHKRLEDVVNSLNDKTLMETKVLQDWTVKNVLSHIVAWNLENIKGIDNILLTGEMPWWWGLPEDEFNEREVTKRKEIDIKEVIQEWENSFSMMINKIEVK